MEIDLDRLTGLTEKRADSPAPLDRLRSAVLVAEELRGRGDELLDRFVAQARRADCSWTEIGATLGVSKQAAHQRFLAADQSAGGWPPGATERLRAAFAIGQEDARGLGHAYLGTEHVLAGLLAQPDGRAARALAALGVDRTRVLARATAIIGTGSELRRPERLGVAPRLKRGLELARAHARALDQRCFDVEHLLLAFCDIEDCVAAVILRDLGASPDAVRDQLAAALGVDRAQLRPRARRRRLRRTRSC